MKRHGILRPELAAHLAGGHVSGADTVSEQPRQVRRTLQTVLARVAA